MGECQAREKVQASWKAILPPAVIFSAGLRITLFGPELVSGAANENVFESRSTNGDSLNLSREGFHDFGYKAVRAFAFDTYLVFEDCGFDLKAGADALGERSR